MNILTVLQYLAFSGVFLGFIVLVAIVCAAVLIIDIKEEVEK